ncbi:MAG TPA: hypothetical protein VLF41_01540 [Candidatus Nanoarchaeia archaeon]|nr:hypothetical protein [Candidatus Nanoarchaeia archaeon]
MIGLTLAGLIYMGLLRRQFLMFGELHTGKVAVQSTRVIILYLALLYGFAFFASFARGGGGFF